MNPMKKVRIRVAAIIIEDSKILMVAHKKKDRIYWLPPGGGVNFGESLEDALKREIAEEVNINVAVGVPEIICDSIDPSGRRHVVNVCFRAQRISGDLRIGREKRLYDYDYFDEKSIQEIDVYPPIKKELSEILKGNKTELYLGRIWNS